MKHTFVAYVEDKPGVLNRVASLFRRRNFNIESLTVGRTHQSGVSRMTIVVEAADQHVARRIEANMYKMVNVLRVDDVTHQDSVDREMALVKVTASQDTREEIVQIADSFRANIVDTATYMLVLEITGTTEKVNQLLAMLDQFGVVDVQRTGIVAMLRGNVEAQSDLLSIKSSNNPNNDNGTEIA